MKNLTDSFIFQQVIKNEAVKEAIKSTIPSANTLKPESLAEPLSVINKRMKYAGKDTLLNLLDKGEIVPIYNPTLGIPKYLNAFLKKDQGKIVCVSDLTNFSRIRADGTSDISAKTLFALLQNSAIFYELHNNWNRYTINVNVVKNGAIIYSKLFGKVLDKLYAIKIDPFKSDLIHFLLAKFFLVAMCDKQPTDTIDQLAFKAISNDSSFKLITAEADQLNDNIFDDIDSFVKGLSTLNMKNLNIRIIIENFSRMYGESTLLCIDYLPAFFSVIFGVAIQGTLAKDYVIEGICGKNIESLYIEFFKLAR